MAAAAGAAGSPFTKAYGLIHDGMRVLVGAGGTSGRYGTHRQGYHLPGGTRDGTESAVTTVLRELPEEFGTVGSTIVGVLNALNPAQFNMRPIPISRSVTIACCYWQIPAVTMDAWVSPAGSAVVTGGKTDPYDSHFDTIGVLTFAYARRGFTKKYGTDWFALCLDNKP